MNEFIQRHYLEALFMCLALGGLVGLLIAAWWENIKARRAERDVEQLLASARLRQGIKGAHRRGLLERFLKRVGDL